MSLENPNLLEKAADFMKANGRVRIVVFAVCGLILLGAVLFTFDKCGDWSFQRKQDKLKANVNKALAEAANVEKTIANLKEQQAVQAENVNRATREYIDAQSYTDETRNEVNKALANMANAARSNGNVSVKELEEKLKGL